LKSKLRWRTPLQTTE